MFEWKYDQRNNTLTLMLPLHVERFQIDLDQATTPAEMDDWITHVGGKTWATPDVIVALVEAFRAVNN